MDKSHITIEQAVAQYKHIMTITGLDADGNEREMHLRKPDYEARKYCIKLMLADVANEFACGEYLLVKCYVAGYNMGADDFMKLEAAWKAKELVEFNETMAVKKNWTMPKLTTETTDSTNLSTSEPK